MADSEQSLLHTHVTVECPDIRLTAGNSGTINSQIAPCGLGSLSGLGAPPTTPALRASSAVSETFMGSLVT